ncbi:MAG: DUF3943 domain-containing protein [Candidatus Dadabacteria bacterium]|nr:DUF3943 domain-containing protein [Candidatus Dadabacteria bacterium]
MNNKSVFLLITFTLFLAFSNAIKAEPPFSYDIPILAKPYDESAFIDITEDRKPDILLKKEAQSKSIADFEDFLRDTQNAYAGIWVFRAIYVRQKDEQLIIDPRRWWKNISHFQNKGRRGAIAWNDGDSFMTNWIKHPGFGASVYLYYRALGYDRPTSTLGTFIQTTLFEYTIEGIMRPPSFQDLVVTPGAGVPLGIILEETSDWLENRESGFLRAMSYIINPTKIFIKGRNNVNLAPLTSQYVSIGFDW